ncbi:MAG: integrase core domain-containing protein, partial [Legionella sp.]
SVYAVFISTLGAFPRTDTEVLDFYLFKNLQEVREITEQWLIQYNEERPHESLGNMTPNQYKLKNNKTENSTNQWY